MGDSKIPTRNIGTSYKITIKAGERERALDKRYFVHPEQNLHQYSLHS